MHIKIILYLFSGFLWAIFLTGAQASTSDQSLKAGLSSFIYQFPSSEKNVKVWTYIPKSSNKNSPILIIMPGLKRNAWDYRDQWKSHANKHGLILLVPEFSKALFPKSWGYNLGNMMTKDFTLVPESEWSFSAIEAFFSEFKQQNNLKTQTYYLFGHSAGAQFVHRFITFTKSPNLCQAISANAGWYTFPDNNIAFPYGLRKAPIFADIIEQLLNKPLIILLGEEDNDPEAKYLRRSAEALRQGQHRLERGKQYFDFAQQLAVKHKLPFNWQLKTLPGIGHSNSDIAPAAAQLFYRQCK